MKNTPKECMVPLRTNPRRSGSAGFTLMELLVAMGVFLVVSGVGFSLLRQHMPLFSQQQNQAGLNITLRNAVTQMQIDVANAGTGYYAGANIPSWPIGVTIVRAPGGSTCHNEGTTTYGVGCFDTLHIIATDPNTPPVHPDPVGSSCVSTDTSSILFVAPPAGMTLEQLAADFKDGDQLLVVKSDGSQMTTTRLTTDADVSGAKVRLQHNPTGADGTNSEADDPLAISTNPNNKLGTTFCTNDWVLKIAAITYRVDSTTDPANPQLVRTQSGSSSVLADQIIGFRVGAMIWTGTDDNPTYLFDPSLFGPSPGYDYSLVRSVLVSLIGRTRPSTDALDTFRNPFDGGAYKIEALNAVINPRNLSMNDN